jgi:phosphoribosylformylglycinamidine synthase
MKCGVIVFPGSNCDRDVLTVTQGLLALPTRMVWHQETDLSDLDLIVIPGGFSYGDYLRCGAIARFSPVMKSIVEYAERGKLVLGICNGFQILTEVGLLPGVLIRNRDLHFICDRVTMKVERNDLIWTSSYKDKQVIKLPIAHGEGRYYANEDTLKQLEERNGVVFRYCSEIGTTDLNSNPNGSLNNIAGIVNERGNVLGMMPHPERASEAILGNIDGMGLFQSLVEEVLTSLSH